jgi:hypothetical protein
MYIKNIIPNTAKMSRIQKQKPEISLTKKEKTLQQREALYCRDRILKELCPYSKISTPIVAATPIDF